mgnify:CR=1 FL=1
MSSDSDLVYSGAIFEYQNSFLQYLHLEDCGMFAAHDEENKSELLLTKLKEAGRKLIIYSVEFAWKCRNLDLQKCSQGEYLGGYSEN